MKHFPRRIWKYYLAVWIGCLLAFGLLPGAALAQESIQVLRSDPADGAVLSTPPAHIEIWFSTGLDANRSLLLVYNEKGRQVDLGSGGVDLNDPKRASMRVTLPHLASGVYVVRWHAVLDTGGAADGQFTFTVEQGTQAKPGSSSPVSGENGTSSFPVLLAAVSGVILLAAIVVGLFFFLRHSRRSS